MSTLLCSGEAIYWAQANTRLDVSLVSSGYKIPVLNTSGDIYFRLQGQGDAGNLLVQVQPSSRQLDIPTPKKFTQTPSLLSVSEDSDILQSLLAELNFSTPNCSHQILTKLVEFFGQTTEFFLQPCVLLTGHVDPPVSDSLKMEQNV
ncbi:unnamed protein product [Protopolystoma xenopodis]|uniref:Uncharacterized protein n=1 Tax=Protopolystoma xenopodis TaxID=117903 RepID=A0A448XEH4_9PLAT|nr:unnamed protein product [Protopolystoma xenopodis]